MQTHRTLTDPRRTEQQAIVDLAERRKAAVRAHVSRMRDSEILKYVKEAVTLAAERADVCEDEVYQAGVADRNQDERRAAYDALSQVNQILEEAEGLLNRALRSA